jgi:hypothetical protein
LITWRRLLLMIMTGWCLSATCSLLIQINFTFYLPCEWMRVSAVTCCDCKHAFEDFFFHIFKLAPAIFFKFNHYHKD